MYATGIAIPRFCLLSHLGNFNKSNEKCGGVEGDYDETEANIIIKYQFLCLLEILLGFMTGILVDHYFLHL
jgi:hypothetical protein